MRYTQVDRAASTGSTIKYRPVLTASQIQHILALAKKENPLSDASVSVIATLAPFQAKIENAGIKPAYIDAPPRPDLLESLGGTRTPAEKMENPPKLASPPVSKEERWEQAYIKWSLNPSACTLQEIKDAQEHRYLHDLMSPEEVSSFEQSQVGDL